MQTKIEFSECIIPTCKKPLGQETKDLDFRVCHEHRICSICGGALTPTDVRLAHDKAIESSDSLELAHARCLIASNKSGILNADPTLSIKQSDFNTLNSARLMVEPDMGLDIHTNEKNAMIFNQRLITSWSHEQIYAHIQMMEACIVNANLAIQLDKKKLKERADLREADKFKAAARQAATSTRPVGKPATDSDEIILAEFMKNFGVKSRKVGLKLKRDRDKAINGLKTCGIPENVAMQSVDAQLLKDIASGKTKVEE